STLQVSALTSAKRSVISSPRVGSATIIAYEHDHRVLLQAQRLNFFQHLSHCVVQSFDHSIIYTLHPIACSSDPVKIRSWHLEWIMWRIKCEGKKKGIILISIDELDSLSGDGKCEVASVLYNILSFPDGG